MSGSEFFSNREPPRRNQVRVPVSDSVDLGRPPHELRTLELTWGVFDMIASETVTFDATGGHFASRLGHRYLVNARATDSGGIAKITLAGGGTFKAITKIDKQGATYTAPRKMKASIKSQEFDFGGSAQALRAVHAVMDPDIGAFDYYEMSCGYDTFNETPGRLEYFAFEGVMTFSASATNQRGQTETATLTTSP